MQTNLNLFRAIIDGTFMSDLDPSVERPVVGVLYPRTESETHIDHRGREMTRRAEMTVFSMDEDCVADTDGGTTVFDVSGWYGHVGWSYFEIPEGTEIPESLGIERAERLQHNRTGTTPGVVGSVRKFRQRNTGSSADSTVGSPPASSHATAGTLAKRSPNSSQSIVTSSGRPSMS